MLQNEHAILEFIRLLVETMDRYFNIVVKYSRACVRFFENFEKVIKSGFFLLVQCELDKMFHLEKAHLVVEEMVMSGCVAETNKSVRYSVPTSPPPPRQITLKHQHFFLLHTTLGFENSRTSFHGHLCPVSLPLLPIIIHVYTTAWEITLSKKMRVAAVANG